MSFGRACLRLAATGMRQLSRRINKRFKGAAGTHGRVKIRTHCVRSLDDDAGGPLKSILLIVGSRGGCKLRQAHGVRTIAE